MYYFYGKINRGHVVCQLYGGGPYLGESFMGGSTVLLFCSNFCRYVILTSLSLSIWRMFFLSFVYVYV